MINLLLDSMLPADLADRSQVMEYKGDIVEFGRLREISADSLAVVEHNRREVDWEKLPVEVKLECGWLDDVGSWVDQYMVTRRAPRCPECDGPLKHATISFGQSLSPEVLEKCSEWARESQLFLVMGSSLVVHPAAGMPQLARQQGARLVIINATETPYDDVADLVIRAPLGETLLAVDEAVKKTRNSEGG